MVNFLKYTKIYYSISLAFILVSIYAIVVWGFNYSIDFVGGTNLDYQFSTSVTQEQIVEQFEAQEIEVQEISQNGNVYSIRTPAIDEKQELAIRQVIQSNANTEITVLKTETVGPTIGKELLQKTLIASALAIVGILLYIAYAFRNINYATAAIVALFHDVFIVIGLYAIVNQFWGAELDTLFVTALLTTMSFSVHDTIVMFDQLRDYQKKYGAGDITEYANKAVTDTLMRSINNSMTIVFTLLALVLLGGATIRFFALALLFGTVIGTYSSPCISIPIAVWLEKRKKKS